MCRSSPEMSVRCVSAAWRHHVLLAPGRLSAPVCVPAAGMTSQTWRGEKKTWLRKPWQYRRWGYPSLFTYLDLTQKRMDENSRLVVVEGPPSAGKEALARRIADEFEMIYVPTPQPDWMHANENKLCLRELNDRLPHFMQFVDLREFWRQPFDNRLGRICMEMYSYSFRQMVAAQAHLFNTGQGIVATNSVFSHAGYWHAMRKMGYLAEDAYEYLHMQKNRYQNVLRRPHLIIYIDQTAEDTIHNIKEHGSPEEANSEVFNKQFLELLSDFQKNKWISSQKRHSEIMRIDPSDPLALDFAIDDIERMDLDFNDLNRDRFYDWNRLGDAMSTAMRTSFVCHPDEALPLKPTDATLLRCLNYSVDEQNQISELLKTYGIDVLRLTMPGIDDPNAIA